MIRRGLIKNIDGLFGYVDMATQDEAERLSDIGECTPSGITVYIPFDRIRQNDVNDSIVLENSEAERRKKNANE